MKLDPRIQDIRDILTPFDDGSGMVEEYCAFANELEDFQILEKCTFGTLKRFNENGSHPFEFEATVSHSPGTAKFCLPYYKVKKNFRPFRSLGEFLEKFPLGSKIQFSDGKYNKTQLFTEYWVDKEGNVLIKLDEELLTFEDLFEDFVLIEGEESHLFGVEQ